IPSYIKPLSEVVESIEQTVREQKATELLTEQGAELIAQLRSGTSFEQLAEEAELSLESVTGVDRSDMEQPRSVLSVAFNMPRPDAGPVIDGRVVGGDYILVELLAVNAPESVEDKQQHAA